MSPEPQNDDQRLEEGVTTQSEQGAPEETPEETPEDEQTPAESVGLAQYRITGMVDQFDEQGVIRGQYAAGSIQTLPETVGDAAVEAGQASKVQ